MQCTVKGISHNGEGIARIEGKVAFIPFAIPGETVEVNITEERKSFSRGVLEDIVVKSPDRAEPICPHYYSCGGCSYQHMTYTREMELKRQVVKDSMERIGRLGVPVNPVIGMETPWQYRNKVTWHIANTQENKKVLGYYESGSHRVIPIRDCILLPDKINSVSDVLSRNVQYIGAGKDASVVIRKSEYDGKTMMLFMNCQPDKKLIKQLNGLTESLYIYNGNKLKHLFGQQKLLEKMGDMLFNLSPGTFFQVNPIQNEKLLSIIQKYLDLRGDEKVLDAYCGVGSIALNIAEQSASITGIESFEPSVEDARYNAVLNNISNCEFIAGRCEYVLMDKKQRFDAVVIDPPRAGCKPEVIDALIKTGAGRIVYVSCNPATLARDLRIFAEHDYKVKEVQPVDMFPRTSHIETVVRLDRK